MYRMLILLTLTIFSFYSCDVAVSGSGGGGGVGVVERELPSTNNDTYSPGASYNLIWQDEFNNDLIDLNKWSYETKATGWSQSWNNEYQDYTDNGTGGPNAFITNGMLVIKAIKVNNLNTYNSYTSARMVTKGKFSFKYGKIAARIALPYGKGIWPAFWMLGNSYTWPASGEIDIMEQLGHESNRVYGTVHWAVGISNTHNYLGSNTVISNPLEFHIYEAEWTSNQIKIGVDGNFYFTFDITGATKTEFHQPYYILLNLAVGGDWPGYPDATTVFPQYMFVDWVRVYQK